MEHAGRFINVQNLVLDPRGQLAALHPCAALKVPQLLGDEKLAFAMTPADSKSLYEALAKAYDGTAGLKPATFFGEAAKREEAARDEALAAIEKRTGRAPRDDPKSDAFKAAASARSRITLDGAKAYEGALKQRLYDEAAGPRRAGSLLDRSCRTTCAAEARTPPRRRAVSILNVATQMRSKLLFPALAHLDSFRCLALFKSLLVELEEAQDARYPDFSAELQAKADEKQREAEQRQKNAARNEKEAEEAARDGRRRRRRLRRRRRRTPSRWRRRRRGSRPRRSTTSCSSSSATAGPRYQADASSCGRCARPHLHRGRALRTGASCSAGAAGQAGHRVLGREPRVRREHALPDRDVLRRQGRPLTPLLAAVAGRAGRRGLDTQGNLVYLGMTWPRIRRLMVGTVPGIVGKTPHPRPWPCRSRCPTRARRTPCARRRTGPCSSGCARPRRGARGGRAADRGGVGRDGGAALAALEKLGHRVGDAEADQNTDVRPAWCGSCATTAEAWPSPTPCPTSWASS